MEMRKADGQLTVSLEGRLDTTAAPLLEASLRDELDGVACLVLDMAKLEYLSSAGLRVILAAQKRMSRQGRLVLKQVPEVILEILDVTGFIDILTMET
ncbi:MAG: STAS domain-containing protein [Clostridia bacterium]|nr:STAS domain-containing protein [Clostridia bacterium]